MRLLRWIIGLPLAVLVVLFALSNRQTTTVALWPFEDGLAMPVYLVVLLPLLAGFLVGFLIAATRGFKHRRAARAETRRAAALERELDAARAASQTTPLASSAPPPPGGEKSSPT